MGSFALTVKGLVAQLPDPLLRTAARARGFARSTRGRFRAGLGLAPVRTWGELRPAEEPMRELRQSLGAGLNRPATHPRSAPLYASPAIRGRFPGPHDFAEFESYYTVIPQGRALGAQGWAVASTGMLVANVCPEIDSAGWRHPAFALGGRSGEKRLRGRWGLVTSTRSDNYHHWLVDAVPKLRLFAQARVDGILAPQDTAFQRDSLLAAGYSGVVALAVGTDVVADELVAAPPPGGSGNPSRWMIAFLRGKFAAGPRPVGGRRLYVTRGEGGRRSVSNEAEVRRFFVQRSFEIVDPGRLDFAAQARLFHEADVVAGPHGAGLTNLAFCEPGTRIVEFFNPTYLNLCYWALCAAAGHRYAAVATEHSRHRGFAGWRSMDVPLDELAAALAAVGVD